MCRRLLTVPLILLLALPAGLCAAESRSKTDTYVSPDRTLRALVVALPNAPYALGESCIEIRTADNGLLFSHSFGSEDRKHGFGVAQAAWPPNSRFFIFSLVSSGGHQPWRSPTYFVARQDKKMRNLDDYLGTISEPDFQVAPPDNIHVVGRRDVDAHDETFNVRLSELLKKKPASAATQGCSGRAGTMRAADTCR